MDTTYYSLKNTTRIFLQIILALAMIQALRMILHTTYWTVITGLGLSIEQERMFDPIVYLLVGTVVWLVIRPNRATLAFIPQPGKKARIAYIGLTVILGLLLVTGGFLSKDLFIENLRSCLVFPLLEEPIFRGWAWSRLETSLPASRWRGLALMVLTAVLFSLWHIGYADVVAHRMGLAIFSGQVIHVMEMKMQVTLIIGLFVGLVRWLGGNLFPPLLLHGFWNLFGR